ncbi:hypothetical protein PInf_012789 [Phytophthora infestans]|nr:hypothetical protein PInf_012789 [Phytophthora infestans]
MSDKKRESLASKIDEVARNQIWREQLKTEYEMESALTPFQLNPKTLSSITLKPTQTHPEDFGKVQDDQGTRDLAAKLREVTKRPTEKQALPMTEAQRVGWLHDMATKGSEQTCINECSRVVAAATSPNSPILTALWQAAALLPTNPLADPGTTGIEEE